MTGYTYYDRLYLLWQVPSSGEIFGADDEQPLASKPYLQRYLQRLHRRRHAYYAAILCLLCRHAYHAAWLHCPGVAPCHCCGCARGKRRCVT